MCCAIYQGLYIPPELIVHLRLFTLGQSNRLNKSKLKTMPGSEQWDLFLNHNNLFSLISNCLFAYNLS